ncbi:MAG: 4Fe-4S dicluster domain-containing protein [Verrucomicrobiota bacterium]|nr:4Fe-4S dicluster domain-containing protein [Verrucomicrobiota bacterium]
MKQGTLKKTRLVDWLRSAGAGQTVYVPVRRGTDAVFAPLQDGVEPLLDFDNTVLSVKSLFFPQCEVLLTFRKERLDAAPEPAGPFVVFGVRPCDARALFCLDKLFGEFGQSRDPYYLARRENSAVISLACAKACHTCFCASVGGDPADRTGADILASDLGEDLLLEAVTPNGEAFLDAGGGLLSPPTEEQAARRDNAVQSARDGLTKFDLTDLKKRLDSSFDSGLWAAVSEVCRGCGLCTYLCPTCHCFDITDEKKGARGRRVRTWDSCQYALFTLHASGHNPRASRKERMRQRLLHKFQYTVDNVGEVFCVGCGRCVANCPVNLDIREALKKLTTQR